MLTEELATSPQFQRAEPARSRPRSRPAHGPRAAQVAAFVGAAGLVLVYALRGGSYDVVAFEEHGLVIWWILAIAFALGLLPRARPSRAAIALILALVGYAAWTGLSLLWTQSSERTTQELARVLDYVGLVVLLISTLDRRTWRAAAAGVALAAMLVCALAVGSRLVPSAFGTDYIAHAFHSDRLSYPFGYWNAVAAWAAMTIAIALAWSAHDSSRLRSAISLGFVPVAGATVYLTYSRAGIGGTVLGVVAILAVGRSRIRTAIHLALAAAGTAAVILVIHRHPQIAHGTGTRGAGIVFTTLLLACAGCAAGAAVTAWARAPRWRIPRRVARPALAVAALVVLAGAAVGGPRLVSRGWHSFTRTTATPATADPTGRLGSLSGSRYPLWKVTLRGFDAHPLDGTGAGTLEFWWNQHATDPEFVRDAHNIWLENMEELGMPGLLLIVAVAIAGIVVAATGRARARRTTSAGIATAFLAAFLVFLLHASIDWMWESTAVTVLALAGVAAVGARGSAHRIRVRVPWRIAAVAVAAIAGLVQLPGLMSASAIRKSQADERAGNTSGALAWAKEAISDEPWSASAYEQRGLVLEAAGRYTPAADDLTQAISREPTNFSHPLLLARIDTERGQLAAASHELARARMLRPRASVFALAPYFSLAP
jgi:hypothetical protein